MKRLAVVALTALAALGCDPLLPLRAKSEIQPIHQLNIVADSTSVMSGMNLDLVVEATDGGLHVIDLTSKTLTATSGNPEVVTVVALSTPGHFRATGKKVGSTQVTIEGDGKVATIPLTVKPGLPAKIEVVSGHQQLAVQNDALLQSVVFQVKDVNDNNVGALVPVSFTGTGGSPSVSSRVTDGQGQVSVSFTPSTVTSAKLTARISTSVSVEVTFTVTTVVAVLNAAFPDPQSGITITPSVTVQLQYASNSSAYPRAGLIVSAAVTPSTGKSVTGASATTNASGAATFNALTISGTEGPITVRFTVGTVGAIVEASATLRGGAASQMSITTQPPTSAVTGRAFSQPVVVQLLDAFGNTSRQAGVAIQAEATGFTIANGLVATDNDGKATFTTMTVTGTAGQNFSLRFTSPSHTLSSVTATSRLLTGVETKLAVTRAMSGAACDAVVTGSPRVQLQDAGNRSVALAGTVVTAVLHSSATTASIASGATATTDVNGMADFTALKLRGTVGAYTIEYTATGLTKAQETFSLGAGAADSLGVILQPPTTVANGVQMSTGPVVRIHDDCGNVRTTGSVPVTGSATAGNLAFSSVVTSLSGEADFRSTYLAGTVGKYKLRFTSPGLVTAEATDSTNLTIGSAAKVLVVTEPPATAQSNVNLTQQPKVRITDVGGNAVVGARSVIATVTGTSPANGTTISGNPLNIAAGQSEGTYTALKITGLAGDYRLIFTSSGLVPDTAAAATVLGGAGTASQLFIETEPSTAVLVGQVFARMPVVRLRDATGANVSLAGVSLDVLAPANTLVLAGNSGSTDATGKLTFTSLQVTSRISTTPATLTFGDGASLTATSASPVAAASPMTTATLYTLSVPTNSQTYYGITVPAGRTELKVFMQASSGRADMYVRMTDAPGTTAGQFTCTAATTGTTEVTCTLPSPAAGQYYILVKTPATESVNGTIRATY